MRTPFDVREVLARLLDGSRFEEFKPLYGDKLVCGWGELHGFPVGVLANNGILFSEESKKGAQFIQLCNRTDTPLLFVQNITGFMVGSKAEQGGIIRNGAKLINAVSNSDVPHLVLMVGASYGAGNYGMSGRAYDPRFIFTWPNHRIAVMGPKQLSGVMDIVARNAAAGRGVPVDEEQLAAQAAMLEGAIEEQSTALFATGRVWDDGIIHPNDSRTVLGMALSAVHSAPVTGSTGVRRVAALMAPAASSPVRRLLIANRGEIAVRIARTAHRMGIATVGIHSAADADALHVAVVDESVALGGASPAESYLRADLVLAAALDTGCDAVHPGYGFLAENAGFAQQVIDAGLRWVGPTPDQISLLGDKVAAKRAAIAAGVPTAPVFDAAPDDVPEDVPMPALVKAAAGGGGRGMRIVRDRAELADAVRAAAREAAAAFGDGTVFIEPYLERGRHVEVQIMGDEHGNVVHLGDRDCSVQRRNQKVLEEAPAPGLDAATRTALADGALAPGPPRRVPQRRHGRVPGGRRRHGQLPRGQHPATGGAPGHRGRHRPGPGGAPAARRRG